MIFTEETNISRLNIIVQNDFDWLELFDNPDSDSGMTSRENAERIIQEYPRLARNAHVAILSMWSGSNSPSMNAARDSTSMALMSTLTRCVKAILP